MSETLFYVVSIYICCCWSTLSSWWSGSTSDETDRVWSEALLLLHVAVAISN